LYWEGCCWWAPRFKFAGCEWFKEGEEGEEGEFWWWKEAEEWEWTDLTDLEEDFLVIKPTKPQIIKEIPKIKKKCNLSLKEEVRVTKIPNPIKTQGLILPIT